LIYLIDSTIVRAHQHAAGAVGGQSEQALGRSAGGLSSKLHLRSDSDGNPDVFDLTAGQEHDIIKAFDLTNDLPSGSSVASDKAYDSSDLRLNLLCSNIVPLIPSRDNRIYKPPYDKEKYKIRYRIECFFNRLKQNRAFATRYDKLARSFLSGTAFLCAIICLRG
jgi:transposase